MCFLHQDLQLNRVAIEEGAGTGAEPSPAGARPKKKNRKTYDLTAADKFWQKHKGRWVEQVGVARGGQMLGHVTRCGR